MTRSPHHLPLRAGPLLLAAALALAGCASDPVESAVPTAAEAKLAGDTGSTPPSVLSDSGQYPNLNIPRKAETSQFTPQQQSQKTSELVAARTQANAQPGDATAASADSATLKTLGQQHAADALKEIESQ
jgi:hypothetical protein